MTRGERTWTTKPEWGRWVTILVVFLGFAVVGCGVLLAIRACGGPYTERPRIRPIPALPERVLPAREHR
jgi:hypothetical protein